MLMARVGFDLLRSEAFQALATAHVQRKLNELRLPDFINSIEVSHFPSHPSGWFQVFTVHVLSSLTCFVLGL